VDDNEDAQGAASAVKSSASTGCNARCRAALTREMILREMAVI